MSSLIYESNDVYSNCKRVTNWSARHFSISFHCRGSGPSFVFFMASFAFDTAIESLVFVCSCTYKTPILKFIWSSYSVLFRVLIFPIRFSLRISLPFTNLIKSLYAEFSNNIFYTSFYDERYFSSLCFFCFLFEINSMGTISAMPHTESAYAFYARETIWSYRVLAINAGSRFSSQLSV